MKKYTKRVKRLRSSRRELEKRNEALDRMIQIVRDEKHCLGQQLLRVRGYLQLEVSRSTHYMEECQRLQEKLDKMTEPVWRLAHLRKDPPDEETAKRKMEIWRLAGACRIAIEVDFRSIRCRPMGDSMEYLSQLINDFTNAARQHATKNLRILLD